MTSALMTPIVRCEFVFSFRVFASLSFVFRCRSALSARALVCVRAEYVVGNMFSTRSRRSS